MVHVGDIIDGRFKVEGPIILGGMGIVCCATWGQREVALKLIRDEYLGSPELDQRFEQEAQLHRRLGDHVHLPLFHTNGRDPIFGPYLALEWLEGETLQRLLDKVPTLAPKTAVKIGLHLCDALSQLHAMGITHRDVKPANFMLVHRTDGEVVGKLLDLGIAKANRLTPPQGLTGTNAVLGTEGYMAPEQIRGAKATDLRTDVWSVGAVLHRMLVGRYPHEEAGNPWSTASKVQFESPIPVHLRAPWVSDELGRVVEQALALEPQARYRDAAQMSDALRAILRGSDRLRKAELAQLTRDQEQNLVVENGAQQRQRTSERQSQIGECRQFLLRAPGSVVTSIMMAAGIPTTEISKPPAARDVICDEILRWASNDNSEAHLESLVRAVRAAKTGAL